MSNFEHLENVIAGSFNKILNTFSHSDLKKKLIKTILDYKKIHYIENDEFKTYYYWLCNNIACFKKEYGLRMQLLISYSNEDSFRDFIDFERHINDINIDVFDSSNIDHFIKYERECKKRYENIAEKDKLSDLEYNYLVFALKDILLYKLIIELVLYPRQNEQLIHTLKRYSDEEINDVIDKNTVAGALAVLGSLL